jgi:uncharacterized membrane protein YcaP (DUF421 family)
MHLFDLAMPWWHFVVRALIVYVVLLTMVRLSGKRSVGQFTPFDMILLILLGNAVQNALLGEDTSVGGGLLLAGTLIAVNYAVGQFAARFPAFHAFVEGRPVKVIEDGHVDVPCLRREAVSAADIDEALRRNGLEHRSQVHVAWLENDGTITIIPRENKD